MTDSITTIETTAWIDLTTEEEVLLDEQESVIEEGAITFFRVGLALATIRDRRLYRSTFKTFEDYCRERWGFSKSHANRYIGGAEAAQNLTPIGVIPQRESHIRPLLKLSPEKQKEAWQLVLSLDQPVTQKLVQEAATQVQVEARPPTRLNNPDAHNEFPTPDRILERVYQCLGTVDLDPCSEGAFPPNVQATQHFTAAHDGLSQDWYGRVFCNPPYSQGNLLAWTGKLISEFRSGSVTEALYLVPNYTSEQWHQLLREYPRGHFKGRVTFKGQRSAARFASVIFYLGKNPAAFGRAFRDLCDFYLLSDLEDER